MEYCNNDPSMTNAKIKCNNPRLRNKKVKIKHSRALFENLIQNQKM